MLLRGSGVRYCAVVLGISINCILRHLVAQAEMVVIKPRKSRYHRVQIDELWSYVARKEKKVWLLYALTVLKVVKSWALPWAREILKQ